MNETLKQYIASQREAGFTDAKIRSTLLENGYREDVIDVALGVLPPPPSQTYVSQTGAPGTPIQVENLQYNVGVKEYNSKPGLVFSIANSCLAIGVLVLATLFHQITGKVFGYNATESISGLVQFSISMLVPLSIVGYFALKRLYTIFSEQPQLLEDIKFKTRLRKSFIFFLVLSVLGVFLGIFNTLGIFMGTTEDPIRNLFVTIYYVGGLIAMTLWLYSLQKKTQR